MDCKNKVVSLHNTTAYVGVELQLHSFITLALDGMSGQLHTTAALLSEKVLRYSLHGKLYGCQPVWTLWRRDESLSLLQGVQL